LCWVCGGVPKLKLSLGSADMGYLVLEN
jgi:hypothetical protein